MSLCNKKADYINKATPLGYYLSILNHTSTMAYTKLVLKLKKINLKLVYIVVLISILRNFLKYGT